MILTKGDRGGCHSLLLMVCAAAMVQVVLASRAFGGLPMRGYCTVVPVEPLGSAAAPYPTGTVIDGDTIYLPQGGTNVWFDVHVGGWAPDRLLGASAEIDQAAFAGELGGSITLPPPVSCAGGRDDPVCEAAFGRSSDCAEGDCTAAWLDYDRAEALPDGIDVATDTPSVFLNWVYAIGGIRPEDAGQSYLLGSFVLNVPSGAAGVYTITATNDENKNLLTLEPPTGSSEAYAYADIVPARVVVGNGCCSSSGACTVATPDVCLAQGDTPAVGCLGDCDGNGVDDACEAPADCNGDGVLDRCEVHFGYSPDCNGNIVPDACDLASLFSPDCNSDGVPDECTPERDCPAFQGCHVSTPTEDTGPESAVAIDGNVAAMIVDAPDDCSDGSCPVQIFRRAGLVWQHEQDIYPADGNALWYGQGLGIDGDRILITTPTETHIREFDGTSWVLAHIIPTSGQAALEGDTAAIGSEIYAFDGTEWVQEANQLLTLLPDSVAVSGNVVALGEDTDREPTAGAVHIFRRTGDTWTSEAIVQAPAPTSGERFGVSIALEGDLLAVGAVLPSSVYLFEFDGTDWTLLDRVFPQPGEGSFSIGYGRSVALDGSLLIVGSSDGVHRLHAFAREVSSWVPSGDYLEGAFFRTGVASGGGWTLARNHFIATGNDCNANYIADACDILAGRSVDADDDGVPDVCPDCNANGIRDDLDVRAGTAEDCDDNGVLDGCEWPNGYPDCNANGVPDPCGIADGVESDCNHNAVPDDCDLIGGAADCDGNGTPDECDLAASAGVDCNGTGTLDACDIADGTSFDSDGNCIPDECDPSPAPLAENPIAAKSRFLSFTPVNAGCSTAIRVRFVSLTPHGVGPKFVGSEGDWRWVGPPETVWEDSRRDQLLQVAPLQCDPHFLQWSYVGALHVYGAGVMPESVYEVEHFDASCGDIENPACYAKALTITTDVWGDCSAPFVGSPDAGRQPDFRDIAGLVAKFQAIGGPPRVAAELEPSVLNLAVDLDFRDIAACVRSFQGQTYPLDGPAACP